MHRVRFLVWAALVVCLVSVPASASVITALSMSDLVDQADHIVVGHVEGQAARWDGRGHIVTDVRVRVEEAMKGDAAPGSVLVITHLGGAIGEVGMRVEGEPRFANGTRTLVFGRAVYASPRAFVRPVGMSQGVFEVRAVPGRGTEAMVLPAGAGLALMQQVAGGRLVNAPAALLEPRSLVDVRDEIRSLVEANHAH